MVFFGRGAYKACQDCMGIFIWYRDCYLPSIYSIIIDSKEQLGILVNAALSADQTANAFHLISIPHQLFRVETN